MFMFLSCIWTNIINCNFTINLCFLSSSGNFRINFINFFFRIELERLNTGNVYINFDNTFYFFPFPSLVPPSIFWNNLIRFLHGKNSETLISIHCSFLWCFPFVQSWCTSLLFFPSTNIFLYFILFLINVLLLATSFIRNGIMQLLFRYLNFLFFSFHMQFFFLFLVHPSDISNFKFFVPSLCFHMAPSCKNNNNK